MDNKKIGKLIATLRNKEGLTQQDLGDKIGVGFRAVSKWERGLNLPDIGNMTELSKIFGITLDELMAGELKTVEEKPKSKKKLSPKIKITISIITSIIIIFTAIFLIYNNKTYVYELYSLEKEQYFVEGQVTLKNEELSIIINQLGFTDDNLNKTVITNYEYDIKSNNEFIFGYGYATNSRYLEKESTIEEFMTNFRINYIGEVEIDKQEMLKNNIKIVMRFLDTAGQEITQEMNFFLFTEKG